MRVTAVIVENEKIDKYCISGNNSVANKDVPD